jgi:hypothetical protein
MEATWSSKTSVNFQKTTQVYVPKYEPLQALLSFCWRCENEISYKILKYFFHANGLVKMRPVSEISPGIHYITLSHFLSSIDIPVSCKVIFRVYMEKYAVYEVVKSKRF